jgi:mRNA-degrading endonuclease YafQ of YafQ-DinJ toxin-antitoxin module
MMDSSDDWTNLGWIICANLKEMAKKASWTRCSTSTKTWTVQKCPFHPSLKTHSLVGHLADSWAININYEQRLVFRFLSDTKVLLIDLGTHDDVY